MCPSVRRDVLIMHWQPAQSHLHTHIRTYLVMQWSAAAICIHPPKLTATYSSPPPPQKHTHTCIHTNCLPHAAHRLLVSLKETNRAAFIALLQQDLEVLLPLVYTPVIAEACLHWDTLLPRPLGLYVTPADDPSELLAHWPSQEVCVCVYVCICITHYTELQCTTFNYAELHHTT